MVARLLRSADFERVLAQPARSRSAHFAAHHVAAGPSLPSYQARAPVADKISTGDAPSCPLPVDDQPGAAAPAAVPSAPTGCWLGAVVPKRHARRAVTRNLVKRQIRAIMAEAGERLPGGLWVVRLKAPFDPRQFPSAASVPLKAAVRAELITLFERALHAAPRRP